MTKIRIDVAQVQAGVIGISQQNEELDLCLSSIPDSLGEGYTGDNAAKINEKLSEMNACYKDIVKSITSIESAIDKFAGKAQESDEATKFTSANG